MKKPIIKADAKWGMATQVTCKKCGHKGVIVTCIAIANITRKFKSKLLSKKVLEDL